MNSQELITNVSRFKFNPASIQTTILNELESKLNGDINLVDASNPFVYLMEASSVNLAVGVIDVLESTQKIFPSLAVSKDDIYGHMSDKDYLNIFSVPSKGIITLIFNVGEIRANAVHVTGTENISRLTIPRYSKIIADDTTYLIEYPINIDVYSSNENIYVTRDTSVQSDITPMDDKLLQYKTLDDSTGQTWLYIDVPVKQLDVQSTHYLTTSNTLFNETILFDNKYHHVTAYRWNQSSSEWVKINTTHSKNVYDTTTPTAVLDISDDHLTVTIPPIYITSGLIDSNIRIDLFTTKGNITQHLNNLPMESFSAVFTPIDDSDITQYTSPMNVVNFFAESKSIVSGGNNLISYENLRDRVITNSLGNSSPITQFQLNTLMENYGYEISKITDTLSERTYNLYKPLLKSPGSILSATSTNGTFISNLLNIIEINPNFISDNSSSEQITLLSNSIFIETNGGLELADSNFMNDVNTSLGQERVDLLNEYSYFYNPFYYVLDYSNDEFVARTYSLDSPEIIGISHLERNVFDSVTEVDVYEINTSDIHISKTTNSYRLEVTGSGNSNVVQLMQNQITLQVKVVDSNGVVGYLNVPRNTTGNGFIVDLNTTLDITKDHTFNLTNFVDANNVPINLYVGINSKFEFYYIVHDGTVSSNTTMDSEISTATLPAIHAAITHEQVTVKFGDSLDTMWCRVRSTISSEQYKKHKHDVPYFYECDEYEINPSTGSIFNFDGDCGMTINEPQHRAGEIKRDVNGDILYKHRIGDVVTINNIPIIDNVRGIERHIELFLIEGHFLFSNTETHKQYRKDIVTKIVSDCQTDLVEINNTLLESTNAYLGSKKSIGNMKIMDSGGVRIVPSELKLIIQIYISDEYIDDTEHTNDIECSVQNLLNNYVGGTIVSRKDMEDLILDETDSSISSVVISSLHDNVNTYKSTKINETVRLSKSLKLDRDDNICTVLDSDIIFIPVTT